MVSNNVSAFTMQYVYVYCMYTTCYVRWILASRLVRTSIFSLPSTRGNRCISMGHRQGGSPSNWRRQCKVGSSVLPEMQQRTGASSLLSTKLSPRAIYKDNETRCVVIYVHERWDHFEIPSTPRCDGNVIRTEKNIALTSFDFHVCTTDVVDLVVLKWNINNYMAQLLHEHTKLSMGQNCCNSVKRKSRGKSV